MIWYGGDYNPEQWPEDVWTEDARLMVDAKVTIATIGVFSWAKIQPGPDTFDFEWLDRVIDGLWESGIRIDLATATASPPPWLTTLHPEMLPVTAEGVRLVPGSRQGYCPSSPIYREHAVRLAEKLAERYGDHPALQFWHINNEYGCHVSHCYCDVSAAAFRDWLIARYGSIEELNRAWGTAFWSQAYSSFDEVLPPRAMPTFPNPTQVLDFDRFSADELLNCFRAEAAVLRERTPNIPITTNFMGFFRNADYWAWAKEVDFVSDDLYPDPSDPEAWRGAAMARDLMRSLAGDKPWVLMEQASSAVNWRPRNAPKVPGQMKALSYQAVARGSDGILFFQWRQSRAGAERFHSAMLPHGGTDTRVWREVRELGHELSAISDAGAGAGAGARAGAVTAPRSGRAAIVLDWDSWRLFDQDCLPGEVGYVATLSSWHTALTDQGYLVDFVPAGGAVDAYSVVVAATLFVASDEELTVLADFARAGGTLIVGYQSGIHDRDLAIRLGGYLGPLRDVLGVWVEEFSPLQDGATVSVQFGDGARTGQVWSELVRLDGATPLATFSGGWLDGLPAVTSADAGEGRAIYVATQFSAVDLGALLRAWGVVVESLARPHDLPVETVTRGENLYVINQGPVSADVSVIPALAAEPPLAAFEVRVLPAR
ncbi:MAG: beta-galactosidase [Rhodoglobus sp.]